MRIKDATNPGRPAHPQIPTGSDVSMETSGDQGREPQRLRILLVEPRTRYRRCLATSWRKGMKNDEKPSEVVEVADPRSLFCLSRYLLELTYEAVIFPLLPEHAAVERAWQDLEAAGYSIGYLFHAQVERRRIPQRLAEAEATRTTNSSRTRTPFAAYLCKARFGCHHRILRVLSQIDSGVLEVRPPEETPHERYRKILNRVSEGFWDVGPDLQISYANAAFKNLVEDPDAVGRSLADFFEEADRPRIRSILSEHQEGIIIPFSMRLKARTKDRTGRVVSIDPSPRFGWGGTYLGSSGLVRDITEQSAASEQTLRQQRELYTLYAVAATLSRVFGLRELVAVATEKVREQLGVDATCAWVSRPPPHGGAPSRLVPIAPEGLQHFGTEQLEAILAWCQQTPRNKPAAVARDTAKSRSPSARKIGEMGFRSMAAIPLVADQQPVGYLWLACHDPSVMNRDWVSLLISIGHLLALAIVNAMGAETRLREEARRKLFYREAVWALTGGKLTLLERTEMHELLQGGKCLTEIHIARPEDIQSARRMAEQLLTAHDFPQERAFDVATCVSEAATNTLLHGGGGTMLVLGYDEEAADNPLVHNSTTAPSSEDADPSSPPGDFGGVDGDPTADGEPLHSPSSLAPVATGSIRFCLQDQGPGIKFSELPRAILKRGYSTTVSMGLGYTLILEMMDGIHLCTDPHGTTLVMDASPRTINAELENWLEKLSE